MGSCLFNNRNVETLLNTYFDEISLTHTSTEDLFVLFGVHLKGSFSNTGLSKIVKNSMTTSSFDFNSSLTNFLESRKEGGIGALVLLSSGSVDEKFATLTKLSARFFPESVKDRELTAGAWENTIESYLTLVSYFLVDVLESQQSITDDQTRFAKSYLNRLNCDRIKEEVLENTSKEKVLEKIIFGNGKEIRLKMFCLN